MRCQLNSFCLVLSLISLLGCQQKKQTPRPNILFLLTDDQSQLDLGAYGNELIGTPNMDALAKESMIFKNAFTSTAMCVPSRTSLFTGLHPMRHGAHPNHAPLKAGIPTVATHLDKLGYKVGLIGKVHINPIDSFKFHYMKDLLDFDWDAKLTKEELHLAMEALSAYGNPFVLFVCISNPHTPWPGEWTKKPEEVKLPPYLVNEPKTRLTMARYYAHVQVADKKIGETIEVARELDLYDDMLVFFSSDHGAEFVHGKYTLYDAGIKVPFMVRWPGYVEAGHRSDAMIQFVDVVPTLIDIAGGEPDRELDGRSMLQVLLNETSEHHQYIYATSTKDGKKTDYPIKAIRSKKYKYLLNPEYEEEYTSWITDSTLGDSWPGYDRHYGYWLSWLEAAKSNPEVEKLVNGYLHRPMEELYDLETDPHELKNIADDPNVLELKMELREKLESWMIAQDDVHYSEEFFDLLENSSESL